jgi:hypothetical protein
MNHITALIVTLSAFASGLYGIYKYILAKYYFNYDLEPIHYWSNRKQRVKKRYKTFRNRKKKLTNNKFNRYYKYVQTNKRIANN